MAEQALKTLPFALPTQCRRCEGRVAIVPGAAQGLGLVIARRRSRCCRFSYQTGRVRTVKANMCRSPVRTAAFWSPRLPLAKLGVTLKGHQYAFRTPAATAQLRRNRPLPLPLIKGCLPS